MQWNGAVQNGHFAVTAHPGEQQKLAERIRDQRLNIGLVV